MSEKAIEQILNIAGQAAKGFISVTSKFRLPLQRTDEIVDSEKNYPDEDNRR